MIGEELPRPLCLTPSAIQRVLPPKAGFDNQFWLDANNQAAQKLMHLNLGGHTCSSAAVAHSGVARYDSG